MLTRQQRQILHRGLLKAFTAQQFDELLRVRVGAPLDRLVSKGAPLEGMAFDIIQAAEQADWTSELVKAAYDARPQNKEFAELYETLGLATDVSFQQSGKTTAASPQKSSGVGVEHIVGLGIGAGVDDFERWREGLARVESCVCRVEVGYAMGTGFLIGPDLVLTAYYVVKEAIANRQATRIRMRFDYRVSGGQVTPGSIVELSKADWLVHSSEMDDTAPEGRKLDYAILRLARPIGNEPVDPLSGATQRRGWLPLPEAIEKVVIGQPLFIAQYASGGPLKVAVDMNAIKGRSDDGSRLFYTTTTAPGAGGAPCFNERWEVIAMHHSANRQADHSMGEGILVGAIADSIRRAGKGDLLRQTDPTPKPKPLGELPPPPPAEIVHDDDPQKDRWGGLAERNGRKLDISIGNVGRTLFKFDASVSATDGSTLIGPVIFHLHDSYPQPRISIRKIRDGKATLFEIDSYGVYTIGAQARDAQGNWVALELDLAKVADLPRRFLKL